MWDLWAEEKIESPYEELMRYQNEINNGGHFQYFLNVEGNDDLEKEISVLKTILPDSLKENFQNITVYVTARCYTTAMITKRASTLLIWRKLK